MLQFAQRAALVHSREWIDFSGSKKLDSLARGEWEWKVPCHPCKLMHVGGTSMLFYCKSKLENKARLNKARFSLFFLFSCTEQPTLPSRNITASAQGSLLLGAQPFAPLAISSAPPVPSLRHIRWAGWAQPPLAIRWKASLGAGKRAEWNRKTFSLLGLTALTIWPYTYRNTRHSIVCHFDVSE